MENDKVLQILGAFLLGDDAEDIGKFDRVHHWQIGAAMIVAPWLRDALEGDEE